MEPVGNHGLACLGDEDYAAIALYMQDQGTKIDKALDNISDAFDTYYLRPGFLSTNTAVTTIASTNVFLPITLGSSLYDNLTTTGPGVAFGNFTTPKAGWYQFGANANLIATGAITANSARRLRVNAFLTTPSGAVSLNDCEDLSFETNSGGGEWLAATAGSFYAAAGRAISIRAAASHANAASSVNVSVGARVWCWYIGSGVEIGSA